MNRSGAPGILASAVWDYFLSLFECLVDDLAGLTTSGTATAPAQAIDNDTGTLAGFTTGEYADIDFAGPTYIHAIRLFGMANNVGDGTYSIQALIDRVWVDALTGLHTRATADWGPWVEFTTPRTAIEWRILCTLQDSFGMSQDGEYEFQGTRIGV